MRDPAPPPAYQVSYGIDEAVGDDLHVKVGDPRVRVRLLQAERVERHGEPRRRVGLQVAEDRLRVGRLPGQDVRGPDRVAGVRAEPHEEHLADVVGPPGAGAGRIGGTQVIAGPVDLLLHAPRHRREARGAAVEDAGQRHRQPVTVEHLRLLGQSPECRTW